MPEKTGISGIYWEDFFRQKGAFYCLWKENGRTVSALRLEPFGDGLLLEALETMPEQPRRGYGKALILAVLAVLAVLVITCQLNRRKSDRPA